MQGRAAAREQVFSEWVTSLGVPVLVGTEVWAPAPKGVPVPFQRYNAAVRFDPESGQQSAYQAKVRLYPFGEYAPWNDSFLAPLMSSLIGPPINDYTAGSLRIRQSLGDDGPSYVVLLCSELIFSRLLGKMQPVVAQEKPYDFIVNMANEGLFRRNGMLELFAFGATMRAIENRVAVVRSSNSGFSGFYLPTGKVYGQITNDLGQIWTGFGTPERRLIQDLIEFRSQFSAGQPESPKDKTEVQRRINEIETVRKSAGVEGWSVQELSLYPGKTLFQELGDWLSPTLIAALFLMNLSWISDVLRRQIRRVPHR